MGAVTNTALTAFTNGVPQRKIIVLCAKPSSMLFIQSRVMKIGLLLLRIGKNQNKIFFVISAIFLFLLIKIMKFVSFAKNNSFI
jgi:hypothetical protein